MYERHDGMVFEQYRMSAVPESVRQVKCKVNEKKKRKMEEEEKLKSG
jgi:hypothetical protein